MLQSALSPGQTRRTVRGRKRGSPVYLARPAQKVKVQVTRWPGDKRPPHRSEKHHRGDPASLGRRLSSAAPPPASGPATGPDSSLAATGGNGRGPHTRPPTPDFQWHTEKTGPRHTTGTGTDWRVGGGIPVNGRPLTARPSQKVMPHVKCFLMPGPYGAKPHSNHLSASGTRKNYSVVQVQPKKAVAEQDRNVPVT